MSVEETADLLGIRPETVRIRLHQARGLLKEAFEKRVGPVLTDAFPFQGRRCEWMMSTVLSRLAPLLHRPKARFGASLSSRGRRSQNPRREIWLHDEVKASRCCPGMTSYM
jgi:hypothetical protein